MQPPTFNHQFNQLALERIEYIRLQYQSKEQTESYLQWEEYINTIEQILPQDQKHLAAKLKDVLFQMIDDYDLQIYKQGFTDGFFFFKDLLDQQTKNK